MAVTEEELRDMEAQKTYADAMARAEAARARAQPNMSVMPPEQVMSGPISGAQPAEIQRATEQAMAPRPASASIFPQSNAPGGGKFNAPTQQREMPKDSTVGRYMTKEERALRGELEPPKTMAGGTEATSRLKEGAQRAANQAAATAAEEEAVGLQGRPGPVQIIPGHMRPDTMETEIKSGKQIGRDVDAIYGAATEGQLHAARGSAEADKEFLNKSEKLIGLQLDANEAARLQRAKLNAERDQMVQNRIARIEDLNRQAQGNPEDLWGERQALAMVLGLFAATLGVATGSGMGAIMGLNAQNVMNRAIDLDMKSKMANRDSAGRALQNEMNLYKLHEESLGDREQAVEATRLAYYQNLMQQLDIYKMQHQIADNDPRLLKMQSDIMNGYGKSREHLDVLRSAQTEQKFKQKWQQPQVIGGGTTGGGGARPEHLVKDPVTGKSYVFDTGGRADAVKNKIAEVTELKQMNEELLRLRDEYRKLDVSDADYVTNPKKWEQGQAMLRRIDDVTESKIKKMSMSEDKSVVREAEHERAEKNQGGGRRGLGLSATRNPLTAYEKGHDDVIRGQIERADRSIDNAIKAEGGDEVRTGFSINQKGNKVQTGEFTGRTTVPQSTGVTPGFRADDGTQVPSANPIKTRKAPIFDSAVEAAEARTKSSGGASGGKKKKNE